MYYIRDLTFILFVRPFIHPSVPYIFHFAFLLSDFQNSFFVWKVWHQRPKFYTFCPSVRPFMRPSVPFHFTFLPSDLKILFCLKGIASETFLLYFLSFCPYPFTIFVLTVRFSKIFFVWKVWHQRPNFYNFCPPVRPAVPYYPFNFRSNRPIKKNLFLFERYNIRDLSLYFLSVCPYPLSPSILTIRFSTTKNR